MDAHGQHPLSGRRAEAARNADLILAAAREVFVADPAAPISAVAERAGVGIAALYRRYPGKQDLLRRLCADGQARYIAEAEAALADDGEPWEAFTRFMVRVVDADTHSLTVRLAGTFTPTEQMYRAGDYAQQLTERLFERTRATGVLRPGLAASDFPYLFEQIASVRDKDPERTRLLRHRYLILLLGGLRTTDAVPLPDPVPDWDTLDRRWDG